MKVFLMFLATVALLLLLPVLIVVGRRTGRVRKSGERWDWM